MIDTNQINQANEVATAAKAVAAQWWPTLCLLTALVSRELKNFNAWVVNVAEFIIRHGGVATLLRKLIWNPPIVVEPADRARMHAAIDEWNARVATVVSPPPAPADITPPAPWPRTPAPAEPQPKAPTT